MLFSLVSNHFCQHGLECIQRENREALLQCLPLNMLLENNEGWAHCQRSKDRISQEDCGIDAKVPGVPTGYGLDKMLQVPK